MPICTACYSRVCSHSSFFSTATRETKMFNEGSFSRVNAAGQWSWPHTYTQSINKIINKFKHSWYKRWKHVSLALRFSLSSRTILQAQLADYGLGGLQSPSEHIDGHDRPCTCNVTSWRVRVTIELQHCWPTNFPVNNVMIVAIVAMGAQWYVSVLLHYVCRCQHHDRHVSLRVKWAIIFVRF